MFKDNASELSRTLQSQIKLNTTKPNNFYNTSKDLRSFAVSSSQDAIDSPEKQRRILEKQMQSSEHWKSSFE